MNSFISWEWEKHSYLSFRVSLREEVDYFNYSLNRQPISKANNPIKINFLNCNPGLPWWPSG